MRTIPKPVFVVNVRIPHARLYAAALETYPATMTDAGGTIPGTARELYTHGSIWLEWRAVCTYERYLVRRDDARLVLREV